VTSHGIQVLIDTALLVAFANSALANWWVVRASDGTCLVVDIEPMSNDTAVTKLGRDVYSASREVEADVKRLRKESKTKDVRRLDDKQ
jgi:hypothetical protein